MKMIYISHPYTGEETRNRRESELIAAMLSAKLPRVVFVNPLNAFRHLQKAELSYEETIGQCLALLGKCDGIIMAGNWKDSHGCRQERRRAQEMRIPVWDSVEEFDRDEVMPDDCFGTHPCCASCACGKCAERLSCWNCNECARTRGKRYAMGYTKRGSCARYKNPRREPHESL